ncbi:mitochondrial metalloendopeptidase OMA1-like [Cornus florida]|uniref:mitochondrial metalloendopeptidase OMA1-like n=1 Tax=Cornus florida TaxID=4283 RepID=UPI0028A29B61|nr:mitochondrial metalloendopeptidase OMA1-like [Cornus florida]XP_059636075.1 mitochondrial metalloendopeptidase OMA1-like [Cornus florida]
MCVPNSVGSQTEVSCLTSLACDTDAYINLHSMSPSPSLSLFCRIRIQRVPYSKRIRMFTISDELERWYAQHCWENMGKKNKDRILGATHPHSVRAQSILRNIVQGMHTGLELKRDCSVSGYGSEGTLLVSRLHQEESQTRPKTSIIKFGTMHLEGLNWQVVAVDSSDKNAAYLSNGKIVISTGLLDIHNSDAEIAAVLGHEVGHGVACHESGYCTACGLVCLISRMPILAMIAKGVLMYISRRHELEADYIGLMLMASAGYDPEVAPTFYEMLDDSEKNLLSTHPSGETRARSLNKNKVMGEALEIYKGVRSGNRVKCFV